MQLTYIATRAGRLSSFLKEEMGVSTGLMNRLKWQDKIFVNGVPRHTDFTVAVGDVITLPLDEPAPEYPAEDGALTVLYEDEHLLAVDKPAGMLIHPSRATFTGTLANRVVAYYEKTGQKSAFHPITRLDRDTFGVVLLAKNAYMHARIMENPPKKTYQALVFGAPERESGEIDAPIARRELPSLLRYVDAGGKPSKTLYTLLERQGEVSLISLQPVTGRTHQLRVHCAYAGYPIVGDPQYGSEESKVYSEKAGFSYQQLLAKFVAFIHPITGETVEITSKIQLPQRD